MDLINLPTSINLATLLLVLFTLVVALLALRDVRKTASLAEVRITYLREEQERLSFYGKQQQRLEGELERERQERLEAQEKQEQERQQRLEALRQAEQAKQEATKEAMLQLSERIDHYLEELEEDGQHNILDQSDNAARQD
jgi:hypothetical protein